MHCPYYLRCFLFFVVVVVVVVLLTSVDRPLEFVSSSVSRLVLTNLRGVRLNNFRSDVTIILIAKDCSFYILCHTGLICANITNHCSRILDRLSSIVNSTCSSYRFDESQYHQRSSLARHQIFPLIWKQNSKTLLFPKCTFQVLIRCIRFIREYNGMTWYIFNDVHMTFRNTILLV